MKGKAAGGALTATQAPRRPGTAPVPRLPPKFSCSLLRVTSTEASSYDEEGRRESPHHNRVGPALDRIALDMAK
jgi:hypothetical protein